MTTPGDFDSLFGDIIMTLFALFHLVDNLFTFLYTAEDNMFEATCLPSRCLDKMSGLLESNEELRPISITSGISHG